MVKIELMALMEKLHRLLFPTPLDLVMVVEVAEAVQGPIILRDLMEKGFQNNVVVEAEEMIPVNLVQEEQ